MKRIINILVLFSVALVAFSVPARKGIWKKLLLDNGTVVEARLCGDELLHYWQDKNGNRYIQEPDREVFRLFDDHAFAKGIDRRKNLNHARGVSGGNLMNGERSKTVYTGKKRGLIILVEFLDKKFNAKHDAEFFDRMANEPHFQTENGFVGSVYDYFKAQSNNQFELTFDVTGPVQLPNNSSYYGRNDRSGYDMRPGQMISDAIDLLPDSIDLSPYDWNGDKEIDQVYVLYAGQGEADGGGRNTIWPHEWTLANSDYGHGKRVKGYIFNTYACGNELQYDGSVNGIGTLCHEFTHCLGLPDMYDTANNQAYGMFSWDLMDSGSYNGNTYIPAGYTSYEKAFCGWLDPIELTDDRKVESLRPLSKGGDAYIIYNDSNKNEYYLLENRQKTGWDSALDGAGLLILHVDYDPMAWMTNQVNIDKDHQHCTIFHADNSDRKAGIYGGVIPHEIQGDAYPYQGNDSLTNTSTPAATLFHANKGGLKLMNKSVRKIVANEDSTISFSFHASSWMPREKEEEEENKKEPVLLHETFDHCSGTGGNDGLFGGSIAQWLFTPDLIGWTSEGKVYGGDKCARLGNSREAAKLSSPSFIYSGAATLTITAAPWENDANTMDIFVNDKRVKTLQFTHGKWTSHVLTVTLFGETKLRFEPKQRFFIDEVKVEVPEEAGAGVRKVTGKYDQSDAKQPIYSLTGQYLGTNLQVLPRGIYIVGGKKVIK